MTFENLIEGQFNGLAIKASEVVIKDPGKEYPMFVIQGSTFVADFRSELSLAEILILDDFQDLQKSAGTQSLIYQIFKYRLENKKQTIITTSKPLREIEDLVELLEVFFMDALVVEIERPGLEESELLNASIQRKAYLESRPLTF
ncbi:MAG TPA: DnaA/Hda family protein [Bacteriovoracaceae bacterium]|nr:DnaA/Hda family protein [Bacteriovoracaceae bacterium]